MTVGDLRRRLSYKELQEWELYLRSYPTTAEVFDWQMSTLLSMLSRVFSKGSAAGGVNDWSVYERLRPKTAEEVGRELRRKFGIME